MARLHDLMLLSTLPILLSCAPTKAKSTSEQGATCEGEAPVLEAQAPTPVTLTNAGSAVSGARGAGADAGAIVSTGADGWLVGNGGHGIRRVPRSQAIAGVAAAPTRVLLEPTFALDECRNGLSTHAYFQVPASADAGARPFGAAVIIGEVLPWRNFGTHSKELYVAGVQVGTLQAPNVASCGGPMPPSDAVVIALVPVRNAAEGLRLLAQMP